jgi:hypothetical protein
MVKGEVGAPGPGAHHEKIRKRRTTRNANVKRNTLNAVNVELRPSNSEEQSTFYDTIWNDSLVVLFEVWSQAFSYRRFFSRHLKTEINVKRKTSNANLFNVRHRKLLPPNFEDSC